MQCMLSLYLCRLGTQNKGWDEAEHTIKKKLPKYFSIHIFERETCHLFLFIFVFIFPKEIDRINIDNNRINFHLAGRFLENCPNFSVAVIWDCNYSIYE